MKSLSRIRLLATLQTAAHQAPPSMGFSRQEYWEWGAIAFSRKPLNDVYHRKGINEIPIFIFKCFFLWLRWVLTVVHKIFVATHGLSRPEACKTLVPSLTRDRTQASCFGRGIIFFSPGPPGKSLDSHS